MTRSVLTPARLALTGLAVATIGLIGCSNSSDAPAHDRAAEIVTRMTLRDDGVEVRSVSCLQDTDTCTVTLRNGDTVQVSLERYEDGSIALAPKDRP